jgi:hypothetical protein
VLWNRETAVHTATGGIAGRRNNVVTVVHAVLAVLLFALGTAGPAVFLTGNFGPTPSALGTYSFGSFVILTEITILVWTVLLWRASRAAGVTDKVLIPCTSLHL